MYCLAAAVCFCIPTAGACATQLCRRQPIEHHACGPKALKALAAPVAGLKIVSNHLREQGFDNIAAR